MLEGICEVTMPFLGRAHWVSGCRKSSSSLSHLLSQGPKQRRAPPSHKRGATDPGWQAPRQVADGKVGRQAGRQAGTTETQLDALAVEEDVYLRHGQARAMTARHQNGRLSSRPCKGRVKAVQVRIRARQYNVRETAGTGELVLPPRYLPIYLPYLSRYLPM